MISKHTVPERNDSPGVILCSVISSEWSWWITCISKLGGTFPGEFDHTKKFRNSNDSGLVAEKLASEVIKHCLNTAVKP